MVKMDAINIIRMRGPKKIEKPMDVDLFEIGNHDLFE